MIASNVSTQDPRSLPLALRTAQAAIHLPEVQDMLRRLSEHNLGIFMPHTHDAQTGEFLQLPDNVMQVESGLDVSFQPATDIAHREDRFLSVGWSWRGGAATTVAACEMAPDDEDGGTSIKHKMAP